MSAKPETPEKIDRAPIKVMLSLCADEAMWLRRMAEILSIPPDAIVHAALKTFLNTRMFGPKSEAPVDIEWANQEECEQATEIMRHFPSWAENIGAKVVLR